MSRTFLISFLAVLALFDTAKPLSADELVSLVGTDSLESQLLADATDGTLQQFTLLDAALIAGGVHRTEELRVARGKLNSRWLELGEQALANLQPRERAATVLAGLHRLLLTGKYTADCTELHRTLESGDFNCVTSTVLYLDLCRRHGLTVDSVAVPGHVYGVVSYQPDIEVQTTCRDWFEVCAGGTASPEAKALLQQLDSRGKLARKLSDTELLGKVYYNRGVSRLEEQDFAGAIELLRTSLKLDAADAPARNNLLAAYNNWALALCDAGSFEAAAEKLAAGREIDAAYSPLITNDLHIHQKWVLALCERGRYLSAVEILERGYTRRPEAPLFAEGRSAVYGLWLKSLLEANQLSSVNELLEDAQMRFGKQAEWLRQELAAFEAGIEKLTYLGDHASARSVLELALRRHPQAESLRALHARVKPASR